MEQLRTATLILPRTGERIRRAVTLRTPTGLGNGRQPLGGQNDGPRSSSDGVGPDSPLLPASARRRSRRKASSLGRNNTTEYELARRLRDWWAFATSNAGIGIFKCSIAYLLGSLGTFAPLLSDYLGSHGGKHMVATCTVYFHPARSLGSQFEAILWAAVAFVYAAFISFASMWVSELFDDQLDMLGLGHLIILVVFCGGGLGFVGWTKQKMERPLVNVACSLTSLVIITVLTKEGSVQIGDFSASKIIQVLKIVSLGVLFTTAVNLLLMPVSARKELRQDIRTLTDSLGETLVMITRAFLNGSEEALEKRGFQQASESHKTSSKAMAKDLKEAKWEHYVFGTEVEYALEKRIASSMQRMAQTIGGLRSAATTQFSLLQTPPGGGATPVTSVYTPSTAGFTPHLNRMDSWMSFSEGIAVLESIQESPNEVESNDDRFNMPTVRSPTEIFEKFILHLGPSMKSLAFTMKLILDELPYGPAPDFKITSNSQFRTSLIEAIDLYKDARKESLTLLYKTKELAASRPLAIEADFEEVAASCGYFSFSLQNCAEELINYLDILEELKDEVERPFWSRRSWNWLKFWKRRRATKEPRIQNCDAEQMTLMHPNGTAAEIDTAEPTPLQKDVDSPGLFDSDRRPKQTFNYRVWRAFGGLRRDDTKFAIKVGVGAALYAMPSFITELRPFYSHWRGEWGLLSYMLVCSMTIGASNTTGAARAFGTCLGALAAMLTWTISQGNVFAMAFLGWIFCLPSFYLIVAKGQGPFGRFILLTYNLSALYAYSLSVQDDMDDEDEEGGDDNGPLIGDIALHRVVAVLSGCLWGLFITRMVWPISARNKFRNNLSLLLLRMGLIWKRDPLNTLVEGETTHPYMDIREELQMQKFYARLEALRASASYEFELKGPFPGAEYGQALKSTSRMLDAFHAMNQVILKDQRASEGEAEILRATMAERNQLCARIAHLFSVMASSIKLEFPLNDALPNTDNARDRLLVKVFKLRKEMRKGQRLDDEDFALLYAFGELFKCFASDSADNCYSACHRPAVERASRAWSGGRESLRRVG